MNYAELFIDKDDVLIIRKELVRILGDLNEAVILNQLNYWIEINKKVNNNLRDGKYWVFNTYQSWKDTDFDFWSTDTIKRTLTRLQNKGIVLTANYNKLKIDKTKWYTIDYEKLQSAVDEYIKKQSASLEGAASVHDGANCPFHRGNITRAIPETTTDIIIDASNSNELKDRGVDASFSKKKKAGSPDKEISKSNYSQEELECYLPNKLRSLYVHESTDNDERVEEFVQIIMYFYKRYKFYRKENHPILTDISYRKIIMEYLCPPETMMKYGEFSFDTYREMIELHLKTEYGKYKKAPEGFNYRISLFMSDNIREHLYRRVEDTKN